jgi:hypothetical protein
LLCVVVCRGLAALDGIWKHKQRSFGGLTSKTKMVVLLLFMYFAKNNLAILSSIVCFNTFV